MVAQLHSSRKPDASKTSLTKSDLPPTASSVVPSPTLSSPDPLKESPQDYFIWRKTESLRFMVQIILTLVVLMFCVGKLAFDDRDKALYWGGVMSLMAWWMPSPGTTSTTSNK